MPSNLHTNYRHCGHKGNGHSNMYVSNARHPVRHAINLEGGWSESPGIFAGYHRERLVTSRLKEDMAEQTARPEQIWAV